jgi:tetratricopeptide (TPR) repeat protein
MGLVGDQRRLFIATLSVSWLVFIGFPLTWSILSGNSALGLPLIGVVLWFVLLRVARWVSPPTRADARIRRGDYAGALKLCDRALGIQGPLAWVGTRRLIWLNRRVTALLALGRAPEALATALEAVHISADPETLANCATSLLYLNRYEEAGAMARRALALSRERSVSANATLAAVMLGLGRPAEAEALAHAGLVDVEAILPSIHPEHYVACLAALCRAERQQGHQETETEVLVQLRRASGRRPALRMMALLEQVDSLSENSTQREYAFALLDQARRLAPHYVLWYLGQPGTVQGLYDDPRLPLLVASAKAALLATPAVAPPGSDEVAVALEAAKRGASARPAPQSSQAALAAQLLTLAGTVALLLWWAVHFYVST